MTDYWSNSPPLPNALVLRPTVVLLRPCYDLATTYFSQVVDITHLLRRYDLFQGFRGGKGLHRFHTSTWLQFQNSANQKTKTTKIPFSQLRKSKIKKITRLKGFLPGGQT